MGNHVWWPLGQSLMVTTEMVDPISWCVLLNLCFYFYFFYWRTLFHTCDRPFGACFVAFECPDLESRYQSWVQGALEFARWIDDFNDLGDPCRLYDHCLGPEPSEYMMRKILWEEKSVYTPLFIFLPFFFHFLNVPLILFSQKWPPDIARINMLTLREWRINPCLSWL